MPRPQKSVPSYLHHKPTNQAYVRLPDWNGGRKPAYLGTYDSPESRVEYARIVQELSVSPILKSADQIATGGSDVTLNELLNALWKHAEQHYRHPDDTQTSEIHSYRQAVKATRKVYGHTLVREFGPLALKAIRQKLIDGGLSRRVINGRVSRIRHIFKWGMGEELVPAAVFTALTGVSGLQKGRTPATDPDPIEPVAEEHLRAVLPFVRPPVRAMIQVQFLTGMRPAEVCRLRPLDIDRTGPVWFYRPTRHKNAHRGKSRIVVIGPKAQALLAPFTPSKPEAFYFSPQQAVDSLIAERSTARKTPRWPSHMARNTSKRKQSKARPPGRSYKPHSYEVAISRACTRAGVPHWHPNQLRHTHGTTVRRVYGLEAAQVALGHAKADTTQIYAERDLTLAAKVAAEIG